MTVTKKNNITQLHAGNRYPNRNTRKLGEREKGRNIIVYLTKNHPKEINKWAPKKAIKGKRINGHHAGSHLPLR